MSSIEFINYSKIEHCFINDDFNYLFNENISFIASISDILHLTEQYKKNNLKISHSQLSRKHQFLMNECSSLYIPEVDRNSLLDNMFEEDGEFFNLWNKPCNIKISPRFSLSLISLKNSQNAYWNDSNVFDEMEEFYLNFESYE